MNRRTALKSAALGVLAMFLPRSRPKNEEFLKRAREQARLTRPYTRPADHPQAYPDSERGRANLRDDIDELQRQMAEEEIESFFRAFSPSGTKSS